MKSINRIASIGILAAVNVASQAFLQFLPNIKPVTSIIILSALVFGLTFALELAATTVLLSGALLGFGPWIPFQLLAWAIIALLTCILDKALPFGKVAVFAVWAFICGYLYGFVVSLDKLAFGTVYFFTYYLAGLSFDTLHAFGNLIFFPICYRALSPVFGMYATKNRFTRQ